MNLIFHHFHHSTATKKTLGPTGCHRLETMQHQGGGQLSSQ